MTIETYHLQHNKMEYGNKYVEVPKLMCILTQINNTDRKHERTTEKKSPRKLTTRTLIENSRQKTLLKVNYRNKT